LAFLGAKHSAGRRICQCDFANVSGSTFATAFAAAQPQSRFPRFPQKTVAVRENGRKSPS
jgi:hypothetical protein